jgi:hypothetical protein
VRRLAAWVALAAILAAACGGGGGSSQRAQTTTPSPTASPTPSPTVSPTPTQPPLTAKDRQYLDRLGRSGRSGFSSEQAAIEAGDELCNALKEADRERGSVNVQLAPNFLDLEVDGTTVSIDVFLAAIRVYCPKFDFLIQEFPA